MASQPLVEEAPTRFFLKTLGCTKNVVDSDRMEWLLERRGYEQVESPLDSDVMIVNTCAFIGPAKEESVETILELAQVKRHDQRLLAVGCMAERYGRELLHELPELDGVLGVHHIERIDQLVREAFTGQRPCYQGGAALAPPVVPRRRPGVASAYLKIADGCDARCAFCVIPAIRGPQRSRPSGDVLEEARALAELGVKEIILVAQDTPAWGRDLSPKERLPDLLAALGSALPSDVWLRMMYVNPWFVTPQLLQAMAATRQMRAYLDMPLQHTHPDVLHRMKRGYDMNRIRRLVALARQTIPGVAIRSQFIVGFPGETDEEFAHLIESLEELRLDRVGFFQYSREEGTAGAALPGQVSVRVKRQRYRQAMLTQQRISREINTRFQGEELDVLVERVQTSPDGQVLVGRSFRDAPEIDGLVFVRPRSPRIPRPGAPAGVVRARVTRTAEYDLWGDEC